MAGEKIGVFTHCISSRRAEGAADVAAGGFRGRSAQDAYKVSILSLAVNRNDYLVYRSGHPAITADSYSSQYRAIWREMRH